jgi:magnesium transporter
VGRTVEPPASAQEHLDQVQALLEGFRAGDRAPLQALLDRLHPADVAYVLEGLPLEDRLLVWGWCAATATARSCWKCRTRCATRCSADMDSAEIVAAAQNLDADEIADLAPTCRTSRPGHHRGAGRRGPGAAQSALSYEEGTVGALMDFEVGEHSRRRDLRDGPAAT